jgi:hypothetical protein
LIEPAVFDALVQESYKAELKGKKLALNASIPRIVKRYEAAFAAIGMAFHKTRPARLFLSKMAKEPETVVPAASVERFELLCREIGRAHGKIAARDAAPFAA